MRITASSFELYDVVAGPMESKNLVDSMPDVAKELTGKLEAWVSRLPKEYLKTKDNED